MHPYGKNPYSAYEQTENRTDDNTPEISPELHEMTDEELLEPTGESLECPQCAAVKAEAQESHLRALAELENVKKRLQREKDEQVRYASENVLSDLLPTLDNLDLALQYGSQVEACKDMLMGVEMTRKLLLDAVKSHGLEPVGAKGEAFDPEMHEAMGQEPSTEMPEGHVLNVLQKGYKLKERLLRPAKVMVSAKPQPQFTRHI